MDLLDSILVVLSGAGGLVLVSFGRREGYVLGLLGAPYWAMLTMDAPRGYLYTTLFIAFGNVVGIVRTYLQPWWAGRGMRTRRARRTASW